MAKVAGESIEPIPIEGGGRQHQDLWMNDKDGQLAAFAHLPGYDPASELPALTYIAESTFDSVINRRGRERSMAVLILHAPYFREAVVLQYAGFSRLVRLQPIEDPKLRAASVLAGTAIDQLTVGWQSLLDCYYRVCLSLLRLAFESAIYEQAIATSDDFLDLWVAEGIKTPKGKTRHLNFDDAFDVVKKIWSSVDANAANEWSASRKDMWDLLNLLAHARHSAQKFPPLLGHDQAGDDRSIQTFSILGALGSNAWCKVCGKYYLLVALEALTAMSLSFASLFREWKDWNTRVQVFTEKTVSGLRNGLFD